MFLQLSRYKLFAIVMWAQWNHAQFQFPFLTTRPFTTHTGDPLPVAIQILNLD